MSSDTSNCVNAQLCRFRDDLNSGSSPELFRSYFVSSTYERAPCCIEHGPKGHLKLPFLGERFEGEERILEYYHLIGTILRGERSNFDGQDLLVKQRPDGTMRAVWTGDAEWSVQKTGKIWHEAVVWAFDLVLEQDGWRILTWEVWADTLSAYLASLP